MQKGVPEISSGLAHCYLSFSGPYIDEMLQSLGETVNSVALSKLNLFSGSLKKTKKQKYQQGLSCVEPLSDTITYISVLDSCKHK